MGSFDSGTSEVAEMPFCVSHGITTDKPFSPMAHIKLPSHPEPAVVVHSNNQNQLLLRSDVALGGLYRGMTEQEIDLPKLSSVSTTANALSPSRAKPAKNNSQLPLARELAFCLGLQKLSVYDFLRLVRAACAAAWRCDARDPVS